MTWVPNSSTQEQLDVLTPTTQDRRDNFLQKFSLTLWMGTSDLTIDRRILEPFSHASAPPHIIHEPAANSLLLHTGTRRANR